MRQWVKIYGTREFYYDIVSVYVKHNLLVALRFSPAGFFWLQGLWGFPSKLLHLIMYAEDIGYYNRVLCLQGTRRVRWQYVV